MPMPRAASLCPGDNQRLRQRILNQVHLLWRHRTRPEIAMTRTLTWLAVALLCMGLTPAHAGGGEDVAGIWLTAAGDAKIRVSPCGNGLCGVIVWLKSPADPATGKPQADDKNANKALASRPIIGLNIFSAMRPAGNKWSGNIYNA